MGISKTEINLRRLLSSAPQQQNQAKLVHYIATLREQLEQLGEERTADELPRVSKAVLNDYSEKIEAIASKLVDPLPEIKVPDETLAGGLGKESLKADREDHAAPSPGLRRRFAQVSSFEDKTRDSIKVDASAPVKLDAAAQAHIEKHRKLQDDLTDEMILDSTEKAVEQSLASTGHANVRTMDIYSKTSKTTCFTWLLMFLMTCVFIMILDKKTPSENVKQTVIPALSDGGDHTYEPGVNHENRFLKVK
ncbi:VESICLE TRANSPORT PROTEIN USE1-RELATED [Salix viminalis]|uniref:VESICLE TRANSPORT PROTEIN USE1-RELATED n=1 Tax=Salix viminalis TaxID=40686 RepID=A0A9Q0NNS5_SALVM|nr:VESICLE TRANSPORT PROTEIN USE1-RELATED [Salix viminalis]